jgi:hypothetical protein
LDFFSFSLGADNLGVVDTVTCMVCQGYNRKSNDVKQKCLHQLQTNSKDFACFPCTVSFCGLQCALGKESN